MEDEKYLIFNDQRILAALREKGYKRDTNHKYLGYSERPPSGFISQATKILTSHYLGQVNQTLKKWKQDKKLYNISWDHPKTKIKMTSQKLNYLKIAEELRNENKFDFEKFNLPPLECYWLDRTLDISINFHKFDDNKNEAITIMDGTPQEQYGNSYPIRPRLDREGHIFTTFQPQLIKRIINQRKKLIENSEFALRPNWILDLRELINDSISIIDITLIQFYNKAEYSPEEGWNFDKEILGNKNNRRLKDKLRWIRQITGNPLNIESEFPKLDNLRRIRNHLNHFDPPTFVVTLEEVTEWLNDILYVGQILIKIREAIKVNLSIPLIDLIVQREAIFNPERAFINRLPLKKGSSGYSTSIWNDDIL